MDTAGQERVLGDVGFAGVFVEREQQQPYYSDEREKDGEVW